MMFRGNDGDDFVNSIFQAAISVHHHIIKFIQVFQLAFGCGDAPAQGFFRLTVAVFQTADPFIHIGRHQEDQHRFREKLPQAGSSLNIHPQNHVFASGKSIANLRLGNPFIIAIDDSMLDQFVAADHFFELRRTDEIVIHTVHFIWPRLAVG